MAFHNDLLEQAIGLVHKEPKKPKQASLRRAVSTANYALFHMLISEASANWNRATLRTALGRAFDHSIMKAASTRIQNYRQISFCGSRSREGGRFETGCEDFCVFAGEASLGGLRQRHRVVTDGRFSIRSIPLKRRLSSGSGFVTKRSRRSTCGRCS